MSAGIGGVHHKYSTGRYFGGGGGGIIINGDGPGVRANKAGVKGTAGEGFGGGGTCCGSTTEFGHPGVILIEIVAI